MSFHSVPPFDVLTGLSSPFEGFGRVLEASQERFDEFCDLASEARQKIESTFEVTLHADAVEVGSKLDGVVDSMWLEAWDPSTADVNLFVTDFGLVVASAMCGSSPHRLAFRSESDIICVRLCQCSPTEGLHVANGWIPKQRIDLHPLPPTESPGKALAEPVAHSTA